MFDSEPPLTPISEPASPMMKPYSVIGTEPGRSLPRFQRSPANRNFEAMKLAITTKAILNTAAGAKAAITAPQVTPMTAGKAHSRITRGTTSPLARCVR
jgi:hypothetical protein